MLFALMIVLQLLICFVDFSPNKISDDEENQWVMFQEKFDSVQKNQEQNDHKIYPFNPNFITDYKGYQLGMTIEEIDRLLEFRKSNQFVNSAKEFQTVTKISDSLLERISPYFKFPDWVVNKQEKNDSGKNKFQSKTKEIISVKDINTATQEDLMKVYGIGPGISERILKERDKYGAFVNMEQMKDIWGLSPEVIDGLYKYFIISDLSHIKKYPVNTATVKELSQIPFLNYNMAKEIVIYRSMNGKIKGVEDLKNIQVFQDKNAEIFSQYFAY